MSAALASLDGLHTELKSEILHFMTDIESLKSLVHASPSFYYVYTGVRQSVLSTVVQREIHPEVIRDALAVHESLRMESYGLDQVQPFLLKYKANRQAKLATPLPMPLAMDLLAFHKKYVEYFAKDFVSTVLSLHPTSKQPQQGPPVSTTELCRIHRSLYRFELYCVLFRQRRQRNGPPLDRLSSEDQSIMFLSLYPPWEVEELYCIHDYLYRRLSPPFEEVAQHDVHLGEMGVDSAQYTSKMVL